MVLVLDRHKKSLMSCTEKRARQLLKRTRAVIHKMHPFTIRLKDRLLADSQTQPRQLKHNPGNKTKTRYRKPRSNNHRPAKCIACGKNAKHGSRYCRPCAKARNITNNGCRNRKSYAWMTISDIKQNAILYLSSKLKTKRNIMKRVYLRERRGGLRLLATYITKYSGRKTRPMDLLIYVGFPRNSIAERNEPAIPNVIRYLKNKKNRKIIESSGTRYGRMGGKQNTRKSQIYQGVS